MARAFVLARAFGAAPLVGRRLERSAARAWMRTRYLRRPWLARLAALALGVAASFVIAETALRTLPLPDPLYAYVFNCYHPNSGARHVSFFSSALGVNVMKPSFATECGWMGYRWHHQSDAFGGRNPATWQNPDVVLLGDSLIYGHGVEEAETSAHFLRQQLGATVNNLGMMGDCPFQYLARWNVLGRPLKPKVVVVYVFENDVEDVLGYRPKPVIRRFLETGEAPEATELSREALFAEEGTRRQPSLLERAVDASLVRRAVRYYRDEARAKERLERDKFRWDTQARASRDDAARRKAVGITDAAPAPPPAESDEELGLRYTDLALLKIQASASAQGTKLVLAYIHAYRDDKRSRLDERLSAHVGDLAARLGVPYIDTRLVLGDGEHPLPGVYLPRDGHLTAEGHRRLAEATAAVIQPLLR